MWIVAFTAVESIVAGYIAGTRTGAEVDKTGCTTSWNTVGDDYGFVAVKLSGAWIYLVMALGALAVTIWIVGGVFCQCAYVMAFGAGCGVHVAIVMAVCAAGTIVRVMGGSHPFCYDRFSGTGCYPAGVIVATDTGSRLMRGIWGCSAGTTSRKKHCQADHGEKIHMDF
jgi:hypothetical protein